ncbi:AMP-binding protein [Massilia agilis]|uniref:Long-chain-fatty-acid--CoA ligase n=1 Tax=Massilia agilis TaxID=1811226 RepID=A0ABT2DDM9_9BURK|nr:AMP-binding protein [Massilia agilis]MCS0809420.1 AMP-binding protein [Massilia agilis]
MHKFWLDSYPPGIPADVQADRFGSLNEMFSWVCARFRHLPAFTNQGTTIRWNDVDTLSRNFAAFLQGLGLGRGERVALMMPNLLQYPIALLGVLRAGCVIVNTNPMYTARELQYQLVDSGASAIVVLDNFAHTVEDVIENTDVRHVITTRVGDMLPFPKAQIVNLMVKHVRHMVPPWHIKGSVPFTAALQRGAELKLEEAAPGLHDLAFLQYTGGTTGVPKGAMLTHGNMVANVEQTAAWVAPAMAEGKEVGVIPLPLYHVFALTAMLAWCRIGTHIVLVTNPRDLHSFIRELKHVRFTALIGVNTLFNALLNAPAFAHVDTSSLRLAVAGGMALQRSVAERWQQRFGIPLIEGYGLTEASPIVCANPLDLKHYSGTIGLPIPSTECAILDDEGRALALGELGELAVRGPQVMKGYWNMPEETAHVFAPGGWLRTGDMGVMNPDGTIKLVDRKKDMIIVSGFKVFPSEVEDVVALHPGVYEVAAIKAADEHSDEVVKIVVVPKDASLSAEQLVEHCKANLAPYKVPKYVVFRSEPLPKSNIGKILRRVVAEEERARMAPAATSVA